MRGFAAICGLLENDELLASDEHRAGVFRHKMDYRTLFTWHPTYVNYSYNVAAHLAPGYIDDRQEWVATSRLRMNSYCSE
jgi:hypothetical protein